MLSALPLDRKLIGISALLCALLSQGTAGCSSGSAQAEFDRQMQVCERAEDGGLLAAAAKACGAALAIVEKQAGAADQISELSYRVGRLERQQRNFVQAETLVRRSLALEEAAGAPGPIAARLVELSFSLAGQSRWAEGTQVLERASAATDLLVGEERRAAANAFRAFALRLTTMGETARAERFIREAERLTAS